MNSLNGKHLYIGSILFLSMLLYANTLFACMTNETVTISWDAPAANSDGTILKDLAGYIVYHWTETDDYAEGIDIGNVTTYQFELKSDDPSHYFAVTAYDRSGNESDFSEVIKLMAVSQ